MNNFEIALRFSGLKQTEIAEKLGVPKQNIHAYTTGERIPERKRAEELGSVLEVDAAWLMNVPQTLPVIDPVGGSSYSLPIIRTEDVEGYGALYHVYLKETGDIVPVILAGGTQITPTDWQTLSVRSAADIPSEHWMDCHGADAIMLNGLPHVLG